MSQGCSACGPAKQLLGELAQDPALVVLSLPVNYWDYMGWKDTLADPLFTARQKGYALARGLRRVYTPELIVNGVLSSIGSARDQVADAIRHATHDQAPLPVTVDVMENEGMIVLDVGGGPGGRWLDCCPFSGPSRCRSIAGRTETFVNVVRGMISLGSWSGAPDSFRMPLEAIGLQEADAYVVLLQQSHDGKPGRMIGVEGPGL